MIRIIIIRIFCIWMQFRVNCEKTDTYNIIEGFADALCSTYTVEFESMAPSPASCLAMCSYTNPCNATIYHQRTQTCYILSDGYQKSCSMDLVGATFYRRDFHCPDGWTYLYRSCYRITDTDTHRAGSMAICKKYAENAHLADIKSAAENEQLKIWILAEVFPGEVELLWLGATNDNGWVWSDGTQVTYSNWADEEPDDEGWDGRFCMQFYNEVLEWGDRRCHKTEDYKRGLCELDIW